MPKVVAKQCFEYDGRMYAPGDELEVDARFVAVLCHVGRIHQPADSSGEPYRTTAIEAAPKKKRNRESILGTVRR